MKEKIIDYLVETTGYRKEDIANNSGLIVNGILESLTFVNLIVFIEENYGVDLLNSEFDLANFESIELIESLIIRNKDK